MCECICTNLSSKLEILLMGERVQPVGKFGEFSTRNMQAEDGSKDLKNVKPSLLQE